MVGDVSSENGNNMIDSEADVEKDKNPSPQFNGTGLTVSMTPRVIHPIFSCLVETRGFP